MTGRGLIGVTTPARAVRQATVAAVGHRHVQYLMEPGRNGGAFPFAADCASRWQDRQGRTRSTSDCVGFVAWCLEFDRYQPGAFPLYGGWINTDSMILESRSPVSDRRPWFMAVPSPSPGDLVVFPSRRVLGVHRPGHVGLVVTVPDGWRREDDPEMERLQVAHCHGPRLSGPAISLDSGRPWRRRTSVFLHYLRYR